MLCLIVQWFNSLMVILPLNLKFLALNLQMPYGGFSEGVHLFPYRTEKLSPSWPMVLHKNAGE